MLREYWLEHGFTSLGGPLLAAGVLTWAALASSLSAHDTWCAAGRPVLWRNQCRERIVLLEKELAVLTKILIEQTQELEQTWERVQGGS